MKKVLLAIAVFALIAMLVPLAYAEKPIIQQVTGGGWFIDECPPANKCTFGFNAEDRGDGVFTGNVEFVDHGPNALEGTDKGWPHVHGYDITSLVVSGKFATIEGVCRLNGDPGPFSFRVIVEDNGEPGTLDRFRIELWTLGFGSMFYQAQGELGFTDPEHGGGNIVIHVPAPP